jgi:pimeloyl-ACP methyl ester carboxylesterase
LPTVKVGDINIYYEIHGQGKPLVLIMGIGYSCASWYPVIPGLSQKYQVVTFDNRGAGQSDKPDIPYTMEMMVNDLAGLLDVIGINAAHIFGFSMGGAIAQHFALRYPERVTSLILVGTTCGHLHGVAPDEAAMAVLFGSESMKKMTPQERLKETASIFLSQEFIKNNPSVIQEMAKQMIEHPIDPQGMARQGQAVMGHDTYERLSEIRVPTLVIQGDADRLCPKENARILVSRIPNAELIILKGRGHAFNIEAPAEVNQAVLDFLGKH